MKIDYEKIRAAFLEKAWVYAEGHDSVKIGQWNNNKFFFAESLEEEYLTELRVFDKYRELKFIGDKYRDTNVYCGEDFIAELADAQYFMYGEKADPQGEFTALSESRGGAIVFPGQLNFPRSDTLPDGVVGLKLGIRNYVRYNPVPVLPKGQKYNFGLEKSAAGAIEVVDYAYTGFFYANGKAVEL
jgi:CRISPR-associated protein (TIGR03984 family)